MTRRSLSRRGFTLIELLVVFVVLGILSSIAVLKYIDLRQSAHAARVAADFNAIKIATYAYYTDDYKWPAEVSAGVIRRSWCPILSTGILLHPGTCTRWTTTISPFRLRTGAVHRRRDGDDRRPEADDEAGTDPRPEHAVHRGGRVADLHHRGGGRGIVATVRLLRTRTGPAVGSAGPEIAGGSGWAVTLAYDWSLSGIGPKNIRRIVLRRSRE